MKTQLMKSTWAKVAAVAMVVALALVACAATTTHAEAKILTGKTTSGLVYKKDTVKKYVTICGYTGKSTKVVIPAKIEGYKVKKVALYGSYYTSQGLYSFTPNVTKVKAITSLDVTKAIYLTTLDCICNKLQTVNLTKNTKLTELDLSCNKLTKVDVSKNTKLKWLFFNYDKLTKLNVGKNTNLMQLCLTHNKLTKLDISKNTKLLVLSIGANKLTKLNISKNTKLGLLSIVDNPLSSSTKKSLIAWGEKKGHLLNI